MSFTPDPLVPAVDAPEASRLSEAGALIIDVREAHEHAANRIADAELRPMSQINDWYAALPRDRTIVVQCATGRRSEQVVKALTQQAGFTDVWNLAGGIVAWHEAGLPVET